MISSSELVGRSLLVAAVVAVALGAAAVALATIAGRASRLRRHRIESSRLDRVRPLVIRVAAGDRGPNGERGPAHAELLALTGADRESAHEAIANMLAKVRGTTTDDLVELLAESGAVDAAEEHLRSRSALRRARAARTLGLTRDRRHLDPLLALLGDPDPTVRMAALGGLEMLGDPAAAVPVLVTAAARNGSRLPEPAVAEALLAMGNDIAPILVDGLADPDAAVRHVAAIVSGMGVFRATAPALRAVVAGDRSAIVRARSAVALGAVGIEQDCSLLVAATGPHEPRVVRHAAAAALGDLGRQVAVEPLTGLLDDEDRRLAEIAAESLERLGRAGIDALQRSRDLTDGPSPAAWILSRRELVRAATARPAT